ncbi:ABC transporter substrate-binding protein [Brachyspira aalborgi]|uniref:ABC transporter substrate-binding protein n=1 Tax=Brachyspira aalborgi TaxID=29522 RepID=UPI001F5486D5|nr:extracellular solute-binding protein [Brachyspira aalborgi]
MKYFCKIAFATLLTIAVISCGDTKTKQTVSKLPTIDENTETEITVWAWNIAAKALMETAKTFNEKYPKIKVNVMELAGGLSAYERYSVIFSSGVGVPDVIQVESDYIQTFAEVYPQHFLDLKQYIDIEGKVDPSKISTSYDSEGKLVSIPWDSAPVVMFYREDLFNRAGIDAASIITWEDYIEAGKKLQSVFPNVKMNGFAYSKDDNFWRCLLVENNTYFLNKNGEITISSPKSIETLSIMKRLKDEGITLNTVNWDGQISASKNGTVATQIIGCWWAGTIKDQMPEMKGKWKIMPMPAFTKDGVRASSLGGSDLSVTASDPIKQAASVEFCKRKFNEYG